MARIVRLIDGTADLDRLIVRRGGVESRLSTRDGELLAYLSERSGHDVSRDELLQEVWGYRATRSTRAVDLAIRQLRTRIEVEPAHPRQIIGVRGVGYRFVGAPSSSLPVDRFVGRSDELEMLTAAPSGPCVFGLVGPGGAGKTRLAQEFVASAGIDAVFCDLEGARDLAAATAALGRAIGIVPSEAGPLAWHQLATALVARRQRVVLDNLEQIPDAAKPLVEAISVHVGVLYTSRIACGAATENVVSVGPLSAPDAVALFVDRSHRADLDLELVDAICASVDRLPLAIEIAAARTGVLSERNIVDRLSKRFRLLQQRGRGRPRRHQTLAATIAWSWELLPEDVQDAAVRLAVFPGSFDLAAADAVCDGWAADALGMLNAHSLLNANDERFHFLESVRAYAAERLAEYEDEPEATRRRHGNWFAARVVAQRARLAGEAAAEATAWFSRERLNLLSALREGPDSSTRVRIAIDIAEIHASWGSAAVHRDMLDDAVGDAERDAPELLGFALLQRARAHSAEGHLDAATSDLARAAELDVPTPALDHMRALVALRLGDHARARELAVASAAAAGPTVAKARAWMVVGGAAERLGEASSAEEAYMRSLALLRSVGNRWNMGPLLANLAGLLGADGRTDEALARLDEADALFRELDDQRGLGRSMAARALLQGRRGELVACIATWRRCVRHHRRIGGHRFLLMALLRLGQRCLGAGQVDEAELAFSEAREHSRVSPDSPRDGEGHVLLWLAWVACERGLPGVASAHMADALALTTAGTWRGDAAALDAGLVALTLGRADVDDLLARCSDADPTVARCAARVREANGAADPLAELAQIAEELRAELEEDSAASRRSTLSSAHRWWHVIVLERLGAGWAVR